MDQDSILSVLVKTKPEICLFLFGYYFFYLKYAFAGNFHFDLLLFLPFLSFYFFAHCDLIIEQINP